MTWYCPFSVFHQKLLSVETSSLEEDNNRKFETYKILLKQQISKAIQQKKTKQNKQTNKLGHPRAQQRGFRTGES